jgi:hypothetical protein
VEQKALQPFYGQADARRFSLDRFGGIRYAIYQINYARTFQK